MFNYDIQTSDKGTIRQEWTTGAYTLTVLKFKNGHINADIASTSEHVNLFITHDDDSMYVTARVCASRALAPGQLFDHVCKVDQATEVASAFQKIIDSL